jgi:cytolysin-activating lysine-acyltransferase
MRSGQPAKLKYFMRTEDEAQEGFGREELDLYLSLGYTLELLTISDYHKTYSVHEYFSRQILPPLALGQVKFYLDEDGSPVGMVSWARISEEVKEDLLESERPLKPSEWGSGEHVFINDFIATRKNSRHIIRDMMTNEVPDAATASSLRRNPDGSVNKINRWFRGKTRSRSS